MRAKQCAAHREQPDGRSREYSLRLHARCETMPAHACCCTKSVPRHAASKGWCQLASGDCTLSDGGLKANLQPSPKVQARLQTRGLPQRFQCC